MRVERLTRRARRIRIVVDCDTSDQFLDLLAFTKALGITPAGIGEARDVIPLEEERAQPALLAYQPDADAPDTEEQRARWREQKRKARASTSKKRKYPPNMMLQVVTKPKLTEHLPPKAFDILNGIRATYGTKPFRKGDVKQTVLRGLGNTSTGLVTRLIEAGALTPANGTAPNGTIVANPAAPASKVNGTKLDARALERRAKPGFVPKPKRYPPQMTICIGEEPQAGKARPAAIKVWHAIKDEFGDKPFKKGDAKKAVINRLKDMSSPTAYITSLMDSGALRAA